MAARLPKKREADRAMASASLTEEIEAVRVYGERERRAADPKLRKVLAHNKKEEAEHAHALTGYLVNPAPSPSQVNRAELRYRVEHWGKGGKQQPRELECANPFAPGAGPVVVIGKLVAIEYEADKLGDGPSVYRHDVTSKDATIGSVKNGKLVIGGSKIRMTVRGIVG